MSQDIRPSPKTAYAHAESKAPRPSAVRHGPGNERSRVLHNPLPEMFPPAALEVSFFVTIDPQTAAELLSLAESFGGLQGLAVALLRQQAEAVRHAALPDELSKDDSRG